MSNNYDFGDALLTIPAAVVVFEELGSVFSLVHTDG